MKYRLPLDPASAEVIILPFHDSEHSPWLPVRISSETGQEVRRESLWDSTTFSWTGADARTQFTVCAYATFDAGTHDALLLCLTAPKSATFTIALIDSAGVIIDRWTDPFSGSGTRQEISIPIASLVALPPTWLHRAAGLFKEPPLPVEFAGLALRFTSPSTAIPIVSLNWIGLRNTPLVAMLSAQSAAQKPDWTPWILPDDAWGPTKFERGLLFDVEALAEVRSKLGHPAWRAHFGHLEAWAAEYLQRDPEASFGQYLPTHDGRYIRASQQGRTCYHWEGLVLAFVGLVREDRALLRHALRYLMCMVHTANWTESAEHDITSSTWSHLSFQEEMTTTSVAILLDWLGFALFPRTRNLIRRALYEKGMVHVAADLASRPNMHRMNQGAVFNRALVLGGLMLESDWPHFGMQTVDSAYAAMGSVLDHYVKVDGGVHEGIGYLCQTLHATSWAIIAYGRARGGDWQEDLRRRFGHVGRYVAAMSVAVPGKAIPAGDCRVEWFGGDALPLLAAVLPDSPFTGILERALTEGWVYELTGTLARSGGIVGMVYGPAETTPSSSIVPQFDLLAQSGKATIRMTTDAGTAIRLWISGSAQGATHAHRDVGQFVLEVNGNQVFIDRGMVQYWYTEAHFLSQSWLHNVLTPVGPSGEFPSQGPQGAAETIVVSADHRKVQVPGGDIWTGWMTRYRRDFALEATGRLCIVDGGTLAKEAPVAFHLQSRLPLDVTGNRAILMGDGFVMELSFPWAERVDCRPVLTDLCARPVYHLCAVSRSLYGDFALESTLAIRKPPDVGNHANGNL